MENWIHCFAKLHRIFSSTVFSYVDFALALSLPLPRLLSICVAPLAPMAQRIFTGPSFGGVPATASSAGGGDDGGVHLLHQSGRAKKRREMK